MNSGNAGTQEETIPYAEIENDTTAEIAETKTEIHDENIIENDTNEDDETDTSLRRSTRNRHAPTGIHAREWSTAANELMSDELYTADVPEQTEWDLVTNGDEIFQRMDGNTSLKHQLKLNERQIHESNVQITELNDGKYDRLIFEKIRQNKQNSIPLPEKSRGRTITEIITQDYNLATILNTIGVTQKLSTAKGIKTTKGLAAALKEFTKIIQYDTIDVTSGNTRKAIAAKDPNAQFAKTALLMAMKHAELPIEDQILKARLVVLGNKIFNASFELINDNTRLYEKPIGLASNLANIANGIRREDYATLYADIENAYLQSNYSGPGSLYITFDTKLLQIPEIMDILNLDKTQREIAAKGGALYFKIRKSLYGTRYGAKDMGTHLRNLLERLGWTENKDVETNLYMKDVTFNNEKVRMLLSAYVDDIVLTGPKSLILKEFEKMQKEIKFKEGWSFHGQILGHQVHDVKTSEPHKRKRVLEMRNYIRMIIKDYQQVTGREIKGRDTPMSQSFYNKISEKNLEKGKLSEQAAHFKGALLWLARCVRPDIAYPVHVLTRYGEHEWNILSDEILHSIICYLHETIDWVMQMTVDDRDSNDDIWLESCTDSDFGGCITSGRSTSGYTSMVRGKHGTKYLLSWGSKRQGYVAHSSAEAEIIALTYGLNMSILPSSMLIEQIHNIKNLKNKIFIDSKAALQAVEASYSIKLRYLAKTQRISIARLNEILFGDNDLNCEVDYINTGDNLADLFTKALDVKSFQKHRDQLGMIKMDDDMIIKD